MKDIASEKSNKNSAAIAIVLLSVAAVCMLFFANISVPFMMDDFWYSTNLETGETLSGFGDVIESQIWHYLNWGGRSITHAFLQLSLMSGERCADVINTVMTVVLALEMSFLAKLVSSKKDTEKSLGLEKAVLPSLMLGLLIACCPNFRMSMLWQAGCANYVYSSVWILAFFIVYIRTLDSEKKDLPLTELFIIPLALITGWSTENMGPSAFLISAAITYSAVKKDTVKGRRLLWMAEGVLFALAGSVICILAPGNFVRKSDSADDLALTVPDRLLQMLKGAGLYLFPALIILAVSVVLYKKYSEGKFTKGFIYLIAGAVLSYGAMIASPHYPDRAAFGTCVLIEVCAASLLIGADDKSGKKAINILGIFLLTASILVMYSVITL